MTTQALNTLRAQIGSGRSVGNGECYALASWYETLITPEPVVGLGAGVGAISGAIGDTMAAANIGTSYRWKENGWTVSTTGPFKVGQIVTTKPVPGNQWGHVAIVEAVNGDQLTIIEQNAFGRRYPTRNIYSASAYARSVNHYITPPGQAGVVTEPRGARQYVEHGTMTVEVDVLNVRRAPNTSGEVVATYKRGDVIKYDLVIVDDNGYVWISYIGKSGNRNYVATGATLNGERYGERWGTFK